MASRSFQVPLTGDPESLVEKARKTAEETGSSFSGDVSSGSFAGNGVEGEYTVGEDAITVTITRKPLVAPWSLVESKIKSFFS